MKPRTTLVLVAVFAALLGVVLLTNKREKAAADAKAKTEKLVDVASADVERVELKRDSEVFDFKKTEKGDWTMTAPLQSDADATEVNGLVDGFASLRIDRVVEAAGGDPKAYEIPKRQVTLWLKGKPEPVTVLVGMENPLDKSLFAQKAGDPRIVLVGSSLSTNLNKTLFDFRRKDVFKFETADVTGLTVKAKGAGFEAAKAEDRWRLAAPVKGLAAKAALDSLVDALSNLKAKEFVAEEKTPEALKKAGLDKPEYTAVVAMKAAGREVAIGFHKDGDKVYADSSQSNKIIVADAGTLLTDLEKKADDLREKKLMDFYSWEADRVSVKDGATEIAAAKEKVKGKDGFDEDKWVLATAAKDAADGPKIETFVRKIEGLEAAEFADAAKPAAEYGLDAPRYEIHVRTKDTAGKEKDAALLVGKEDSAKKQVFAKVAGRDEVFRVDASFLQDLPKAAKDWLPAPPAPEKPEAKPADAKK